MLNSLKFKAHKKAQRSMKLLEESERLDYIKSNERYSDQILENKLIKDIGFFKEIGERYIQESHSEQYGSKLKALLENVEGIYKEVNVKPYLVSAALNENTIGKVRLNQKQLTENEIFKIYSNYLEKNIRNSFSKPLFEGTLLNDYKKDIKSLMEAVVITESASEIGENTELFTKYAIFEKLIYESIMDIMFPGNTKEKIELFENTQNQEYFEVFEKNIRTMRKELQENCLDLASMIAPTMFANSVESAGIPDMNQNTDEIVNKDYQPEPPASPASPATTEPIVDTGDAGLTEPTDLADAPIDPELSQSSAPDQSSSLLDTIKPFAGSAKIIIIKQAA